MRKLDKPPTDIIFAILDSPPEQPEKSNAVQLERSKGTILFDHVKFCPHRKSA
jgi:ABC-type bacteriocin/lantibiotic exporter with double-glycine peptidase domain